MISLAASGVPGVTAEIGQRQIPDCRTSDTSDLVHVAGLGRVCREGTTLELLLEDGTTVRTHGWDPVPEAPSPSPTTAGAGDAFFPTHLPGALASEAPGATAPPVAPYCEFGEAPPRTVVIAAHPYDKTDRTTDHIIRGAIDDMARFQFSEAEAFDRYVAYRFACNDQGTVRIYHETLPTHSTQTSFSTIIDDLRDVGYDYKFAKYLIWYENELDCNCGGIATYEADDSASSENMNNRGPSYAVVSGNFRWGYGDGAWRTAMHELGHVMGAVQSSSPNFYDNYGGPHCSDEYDIMCYGPDTYWRCGVEQWDCGKDDYWNPDPEPGSYLDTHWNIAHDRNNFMEVATPEETPTEPTNLTALPGEEPGTTLLVWDPPADPGASLIRWYTLYTDLGINDDWIVQPERASPTWKIIRDDEIILEPQGPEGMDLEQAYGVVVDGGHVKDTITQRAWRVGAVNHHGEGPMSNVAYAPTLPDG